MRLALLIILRVSWTEKLGGGGDDRAVVLVSAAESTSGNIFQNDIGTHLLKYIVPICTHLFGEINKFKYQCK